VYGKLYVFLMKPIQIVLDEELVSLVDTFAKQRKQTRSAFVREALAETLKRMKRAAAVEAIVESYRKHPLTKEERAEIRAMDRATARSMRQLDKEDPW
jgi:predicted transcriptional regulator